MIDAINGIQVLTKEPKTPISPSSRVANNVAATSSNDSARQAKRMEETLSHLDVESRESIERTIQALRDYVESNNRSLKIQVHQGTGAIIIKVISEKDGSVIREIPSEKLLDLVANIKDFTGTLFNKNA